MSDEAEKLGSEMRAGKFIKREARILTELFDEKDANGIKPGSGLSYDDWNGMVHQGNERSNRLYKGYKMHLIKYINQTFELTISLDDHRVIIGDRDIELAEYRPSQFAGTQSIQNLEDINGTAFREKINEILAAITGGMQHFRDIAEESPFIYE